MFLDKMMLEVFHFKQLSTLLLPFDTLEKNVTHINPFISKWVAIVTLQLKIHEISFFSFGMFDLYSLCLKINATFPFLTKCLYKINAANRKNLYSTI